jgi:hemolysin activation/secretion protein
MKIKITFFVLLSLISATTFSQRLSLEVYSNVIEENKLLSTMDYNKNFNSNKELIKEVEKIVENLQKIGFIKASIESIKEIRENKYSAELSIKRKYRNIYVLGLDSMSLEGYKNYVIIDKKNYLKIPIINIQDFFEKLNQFISVKGFPFNSAKFRNIESFDKDSLKAIIEINYEKERKIDKVVIKGYEKFPKSYLKHLSKYKIGNRVNLDDIRKKSELLNQLGFIKQTKKPEILFTNDSTIIYLYIEKKKKNSFDGFLGFSNDELDNNIQLQGYLDFELVNNFNFGEEIEFLYKSEKNADRILKTDINLPYIFSSPIGINIGLILTKKDSTFVSNEQFINLFYKNSKNHKFSLGIRSINSDEQLQIQNSEFEDFETLYKDFQYEHVKLNQNNLLFPVKNQAFFKISHGKRISEEQKNEQLYVNLDIAKIFEFGSKNSIYLNIKSEILESDTYFTNELPRFGGAKSIRGFDENSLFSNKYFLLISEYRFRLNNTIYINSIFDLGNFENKIISTNTNIYGIGIGVGLLTKGGLFTLNYANGSNWKEKIDSKNSKIHITFRSFF